MSQDATVADAAGAAPVAAPAADATGTRRMIQMPEDQVGEGGWQETVRRRKAYDELMATWTEAGYQPEQLGLLAKEFVGGQQGAEQAPYQPPPVPGMTESQARQMFTEMMQEFQRNLGGQFNEALQQRDQRVQQEWQRGQQVQQARGLRDEVLNKALTEWGHAPETPDGKPNPFARMLKSHFQDILWDVMDERRPEGVEGDDLRHFYETPTEADLKAARERMDWVKDAKYQMAAQVAQEQSGQPATTLGPEAGGRQQKEWDDMTPQEQQDAAVPPGSLSE